MSDENEQSYEYSVQSTELYKVLQIKLCPYVRFSFYIFWYKLRNTKEV